jgi:hypothetical protein
MASGQCKVRASWKNVVLIPAYFGKGSSNCLEEYCVSLNEDLSNMPQSSRLRELFELAS